MQEKEVTIQENGKNKVRIRLLNIQSTPNATTKNLTCTHKDADFQIIIVTTTVAELYSESVNMYYSALVPLRSLTNVAFPAILCNVLPRAVSRSPQQFSLLGFQLASLV